MPKCPPPPEPPRLCQFVFPSLRFSYSHQHWVLSLIFFNQIGKMTSCYLICSSLFFTYFLFSPLLHFHVLFPPFPQFHPFCPPLSLSSSVFLIQLSSLSLPPSPLPHHLSTLFTTWSHPSPSPSPTPSSPGYYSPGGRGTLRSY